SSVAHAGTGPIVVAGQVAELGTCSDIVVAELEPETGVVRRVRRLDGSAHADSCDVPSCEGSECSGYEPFVDQDRAFALAAGTSGRVALAGELSVGRHGRSRGLVASIPVGRR